MTKVIRVTESTYAELVKDAHYNDTMDKIIRALLENKKGKESFNRKYFLSIQIYIQIS